MKPLEIIIGAVVLLISIVLIVICMMQEQKPQNATAALTGASNDSFYDKNRGRTKEPAWQWKILGRWRSRQSPR